MDGIVQKLPPGGEEEALRDMFAKRNFLDMQGRPGDVREITDLITSPDFFGSAESFNVHMRERLRVLLLGYIKKAPELDSSLPNITR